MPQLRPFFDLLENELPRRLPASEFIASDLPERPPLLDPILSSNTLALLYGPRGVGKSFVALGIAWAAASGGSFLGWHANRPHRVLYVDGEMAARDLRRRLKLFGDVPPTLDIMQADMNGGCLPDLGDPEGQLQLVASWGHPELVVLDNLASLVGANTGDPDSWGALQRFLIKQRHFGRAVLLLHHANKKGEQRGTNRREDVLDLVMALRQPADYESKQGARFEIHFEKARGLYGEATEPIEARLEIDACDGARWHWQPTQVGDLQRVVALLRDGLTPYRAARELGLSESKAYRLRRRAAQLGLLT